MLSWGLIQNSLQDIGNLATNRRTRPYWIAAKDVDVPGYQCLMEYYMDISPSYEDYNQAAAWVNTAVRMAMSEKLDNTVILVAGRVVASANGRDIPNL